MRATTRLYLTADRAALVREHDPRAATLYAAIGDEIPDSAVQRFGLVDGTADLADPVSILPEPILRVTSTVGATVHVAGYAFGPAPVAFAKGDIDEGQLLAMLKEPALRVETMAFMGDEAKDWIDIPGRDEVIAALEAHVAYDLLAGRDHDRVGLPPEPGHYAQAKEAAPGDNKQAPTTPDKEAAPAKTKARGQRAGGHQPKAVDGDAGPGAPPAQGSSAKKG